MTNQFIALIGIDEEGKRRGGKFKSKDWAAVEKAAAAMKLHVANPKTPEAAKLVASLPEGRLTDDGAAVPLFRRKSDPLWETFFPLPESSTKAPEPKSQPIWGTDLVKGSRCIAPEFDAKNEGYWRAEIVGISPDKKTVTLKWLDGPASQAPVTMAREQVALLHPKFQ